jgi:hypothetical protein
VTRRLGLLAGCIAGLLTAGTANATPIYPTYTTFGALPGATFGGSGIPNDPVAITTILDGSNIITLGLTATARYNNPAVTNDGAGTFTAGIGGDAAHGQPGYAKWNFDFYASQTSGNYVYDLLYDLDPAAGTQGAALGNVLFPMGGATTTQDSWNLGFGFLRTGAAGVTTPDYLPGFSPGANGQYSFALIAKDATTGVELGRSAILVNVNSVPEPPSMMLLGTGLATLVVARSRKKALQIN